MNWFSCILHSFSNIIRQDKRGWDLNIYPIINTENSFDIYLNFARFNEPYNALFYTRTKIEMY
jgi:hypothetical protein